MAEADCAICAASGYRSCDECGGIVFGWEPKHDGRELCPYCLQDLGVDLAPFAPPAVTIVR